MTVGKASFSRLRVGLSSSPPPPVRCGLTRGSTFLPYLFPIINVRSCALAKRTEGTNAKERGGSD